MFSLRKKITRNLIINMVIVMCGLLVILYFSMQQILTSYVLTRLQDDAESLITVIQQDQNQHWQINPDHMSTVYNRVRSGHYYQLSINRQVISSRSLFDAQFPVAEYKNNQHLVINGPGGEVWLIWHQQVFKNQQVIELLIAEDIHPLNLQLIKYTGFALILLLIVTSILISMQQYTLNKAFHIFEVLRQNLASIRYRKTEKSGIEVPSEITPLVQEIEILVDQLRNRIQRTRRAIGNLAHELKRPMQLLYLQQEQQKDLGMLAPLDEIQNIVNRELKRAKISGGQNTGGAFDFIQELPFIIDVLHKIYPRIHIKFDKPQTTLPLGLDRDDMLELTGNLLDNACKFAHEKVEIQVKQTNQQVSLFIDDDGDGIDSDAMDEILKRGVRLDESAAGHGLGLSICTDILNSYEGRIQYENSYLGGLKVTVEIPLNTDRPQASA
jgi:signal transduction histidine kinase